MKRILTVGALALVVLGGAAMPAAADPIPNVIIGTLGPDILWGTRHNDLIYGRTGRDWIVGRRGNDLLVGGAGNDRISAHGPLGHSGSDRLRGGLGSNDVCIGDPSDVFEASCEVIIVRG